jgi:chemotaxis protein CheD
MTSNRYSVRIGEARVAGADSILFTIGLGSCVAIVLYDDTRHIGGIAHAMLPSPETARRATPLARFASTAVPELIGMMREAGASREALRARLAGGASMFESVLPDNGRRLGMRNVEAAREALAAAGIPVAGEDVGGAHGRSVYLHVEDGRVVVSSVLRTDVLL